MKRLMAATTASLVTALAAAQAVEVTVTVTNTQGEGGLSLTPLWLAFHDGGFDAFDLGGTASQGVEDIAEVGVAAAARDELLATQASALGGLVGSPSGPPPIQPGETVSVTFDLDPTDNRFVQFLSMILPSNDAFIGLDDSVALFGDDGTFLGPQTFEITSALAFDAGTEANDPAAGGAFVDGVDATAGGEEGGVITTGLTAAGLGLTDGLLLADGSMLSLVLAEAFFGGQAALGTITIDLADASPVPIPGALLLMGPALLGLGAARARAKRA